VSTANPTTAGSLSDTNQTQELLNLSCDLNDTLEQRLICHVILLVEFERSPNRPTVKAGTRTKRTDQSVESIANDESAVLDW